MQWSDIREHYPDRWILAEVLESKTSQDGSVQLEELALIECCRDGREALEAYQRHRNETPQREFIYLHTSQEKPKIRERAWSGVRWR